MKLKLQQNDNNTLFLYCNRRMGCGVSSEEPSERGKYILLVITRHQVTTNEIFCNIYLTYSTLLELFPRVSMSYEFF